MNEVQEEEAVKRWIAQGKVRRSVSWWNTFVKWVLNLTLGNIVHSGLVVFVYCLLKRKSAAETLNTVKAGIPMSFFSQFLSFGPLSELIGFLIVPATKRLVFQAAIKVLRNLFTCTFLRLAIPWAVNTRFAQEMLRRSTEAMMKNQQTGFGGMNGRLIGGPDEL